MKLQKILKLVNYLKRRRKRDRMRKKIKNPLYFVEAATRSCDDEPWKTGGGLCGDPVGGLGGGFGKALGTSPVEECVDEERSNEVKIRWSSLRRKLMVGENPCRRKVNS